MPARRCHSRVVGIAARRSTVAGSGISVRRRSTSAAAASATSAAKSSIADSKRASSSLRFLARRCFCSNHMPIAITGLSAANMAKRASPRIITMAPASTSGASTVMKLNLEAGGTSLRAGAPTGSAAGGRPGRGGLLKGAVPGGGEVVQRPGLRRPALGQERAHQQRGPADHQGAGGR